MKEIVLWLKRGKTCHGGEWSQKLLVSVWTLEITETQKTFMTWYQRLYFSSNGGRVLNCFDLRKLSNFAGVKLTSFGLTVKEEKPKDYS